METQPKTSVVEKPKPRKRKASSHSTGRVIFTDPPDCKCSAELFNQHKHPSASSAYSSPYRRR